MIDLVFEVVIFFNHSSTFKMINFIGALTKAGINRLRFVFFKRNTFFGERNICILHSIENGGDAVPVDLTSKQQMFENDC